MAIVGGYGEREAVMVSVEAKPGPGWGRVRSRRTAEARCREVVEESQSGAVLGMALTPILVEEDDDDVAVSSPRSHAQAVLRSRLDSHHSTEEEDALELRLGPGGGMSETSLRTNSTQRRQRRPVRPTIDLTTPSRTAPGNDDCVVILEYTKSRKRKSPVLLDASLMEELHSPVTPVEDYKLHCAICMDTMKEETSTICGHIFCRRCIHEAIESQKKCPTCRRRLTLENTHRIYL